MLPVDVETYEGRVRELSALIAHAGCDVVVANTLADFAAIDAANRLGIPTVWAIHESFALDHWLQIRFGLDGPHPYIASRMKASLAEASRLVFESRATSDLFGPYAQPERRQVVPYGVDVDAIDRYAHAFDRNAGRARRGLSRDATVLLCVGTVEERKAQACLVEAFAEAAADSENAVLVLVGDRPVPYSAALHRLVDSLALGNRIRIVPVSADIWEWYALADILVSASDVESLPRSMLEAMAFGVPVLSAAVFGVPELISDGDNGWLYEARDTDALAAALRRALDEPTAAREAKGALGRSLVLERYRSTNYADTYLELFRELTRTGVQGQDDTAPDDVPADTEDRLLRDSVDERTNRIFNVARPYTMTSYRRVVALCDAVRYITARGVPGDVLECGVWRGGSMLAAAMTLLEQGDTERTLWLYDTFDGMTPPGDFDYRAADHESAAALMAAAPRRDDLWAVAGVDEVKRVMALSGYPEEHVRYVQGPVDETLPTTMPEAIALLRLDTDWYESTRHELIHLFPRLVTGGVLIIDDYGDWEGARQAVDEYFAASDRPMFLARVDHTGRMGVVSR
jgi:glycosyltransferase involved in cell wall biosynthesis